MTEALLHQLSDRVLTVSFNRCEKKNALTHEMYEALVQQFERANDKADIRAVVLRGEGQAFTAGNDLRDFMEHPPESMDSPVGRVLRMLPKLAKPLIAAVDGPAVGIGTTLLLHCDFAYCSPRARFQMPFVPLGLCPEAGSSVLVPALAGRARASELLILGEAFGPEDARALGLVNGIVEPDALDAAARATALRVAALPPSSVRLTKRLIQQGQADVLHAAMEREGEHFMARLRSDEAAEAMQAFLAKREPDFSNFE